MTDHVHEWVWNEDRGIPYVCKEPDCRRFLDGEMAESMLNAAEQLSAEKAEAIAHCDCEFDEDKNVLLAYAKARSE